MAEGGGPAGEEGEELRALRRALWAPSRPGLGRVRAASAAPGRPRAPAHGAVNRKRPRRDSQARLFSAPLFTIWRPAFKLYFYSQRHFDCIYDLQTPPGEQRGNPGVPYAEAPRRPGLRPGFGLLSFSASVCPLLPPSSHPSPRCQPLRKSGRVRQLKLPLGAAFSSPLRIGEPFTEKFFAAGAGFRDCVLWGAFFRLCAPREGRGRERSEREGGSWLIRLLLDPPQQLKAEQSCQEEF